MSYNLIIIIILSVVYNTSPTIIRVSKNETQRIGKLIWKNECGGTIEGLTYWVKGEPCASLGIGHFIWYPKNATSIQYTQTFPSLLTYFKQHGVTIPKWLEKTKKYCPWTSRKDFFDHYESEQMKELRTLLANHVELQTQFIIDRLMQSLPHILKHASIKKRAHIKKQFYRVARSRNGLYVLIDYINFKGEGTNPKERYNNKGWGLLQVLDHMNGTTTGPNALYEFAQAATSVLKNRVNNAPNNNNIDKEFLPGWLNRIKTYTQI